jgi:hypothetical protein
MNRSGFSGGRVVNQEFKSSPVEGTKEQEARGFHGPLVLWPRGATLAPWSSQRPPVRTPKLSEGRPIVFGQPGFTSPSSGTEQRGSREAPSALYFWSHLDPPEFATSAGANSLAAPSAAWVSSPSSGTRQASHPASVVLEFSDVLSIPALAPDS